MSQKRFGLSRSGEECDHTNPTFTSHYQMGLRTGWKLKDLWMLNHLQRSNDLGNIIRKKSSEWYQKNFLGNQYEKYR